MGWLEGSVAAALPSRRQQLLFASVAVSVGAASFALGYFFNKYLQTKKMSPEELTLSNCTNQEYLRLMFFIAEKHAEREGVLHHGIACDTCKTSPIKGIRYKCANCPNYDLCETCEASAQPHHPKHVFLKIRTPIPFQLSLNIPPLKPFFPGKSLPDASLPWESLKLLAESANVDRSWVTAYYAQFLKIADKHEGWNVTLSRQRLRSLFGDMLPVSPCITDAVYKMLDCDADGSISFSDFLMALQALNHGTFDDKVVLALRGIPVDSAGMVTKASIIELLGSAFAVTSSQLGHYLDVLTEDTLSKFDETGTQPVSSAFTAPFDSSPQVASKPISSNGRSATTNTGTPSHLAEGVRQLAVLNEASMATEGVNCGTIASQNSARHPDDRMNHGDDASGSTSTNARSNLYQQSIELNIRGEGALESFVTEVFDKYSSEPQKNRMTVEQLSAATRTHPLLISWIEPVANIF